MKLEDLKQLVPNAEVVEFREDATYLIVVNGKTVPMVTLEGLVKWITEQPIRRTGGMLNPVWLEVLMGFPENWSMPETQLAEMQCARKSRSGSGKE